MAKKIEQTLSATIHGMVKNMGSVELLEQVEETINNHVAKHGHNSERGMLNKNLHDVIAASGNVVLLLAIAEKA